MAAQIVYRGSDMTLIIPIGDGQLEITTTFQEVEGSDSKFAVKRECQHKGMLPREIMLDLVRWWEERAPSIMEINGQTVLEFLENM